MLGLRFERGAAPLWLRGLIPILSILLTILLASVFIALAGVDPLNAFNQLLIVPLTKASARSEIIFQATPLILVGVAVAFAFASGYYNIGAEGQLYAGALAAAWLGTVLTDVPPIVAIPIMLVGGFAAGALWALPPALLKVKLQVDEVVTTLLLNSVMLFFVSAILNGPWRDPVSGMAQSPEIAKAATFPILVARTRIHFGLIIAIVALVALWWIFSRTRFGLELRAVGMGKDAARFMGIRVGSVMLAAALISGGIAGLAGVSEVAGRQHQLILELSPGYGYTGIIIATLGAMTAPGVGLAALFLALVDNGVLTASRTLKVPTYLGDVIQALLLLVTLGVLLLNRYRPRWRTR
jgi:simple sugar transport system permease protein